MVAGRYRLDARVGAGGMGVVWRATDTLLDRVVAVKQVRLAGLGAEDAGVARTRVLREARVAARLHHPHAVTVFDVVDDGPDPWLVLEFVPSRSLEEVLAERGPLPPADVGRIGRAVASALAAAHAAGIVHRDVKPANVLLGADGAVKLTDFGISRLTGDPALTASGVLVGTPAYLAPEVANGYDATPGSDVFSLGATLYAGVEGHGPYGRTGGSNMLSVLRQAAEGRVPAPTRAGPLAPVLARMLDAEPGRRPGAAELTGLLAPDRPSTVAPRSRRTPWLVGLAGLLVAAMVAVLVVVLRGVGGDGADGGAVAAPAPVPCDTTRGDLTVGVLAPLTGALASLGTGIRDSVDLAVTQANARCATPGYRLVVRAEDDQALPQPAADAAARLAADPSVIGVVGTLNSSTAQAAQPVLADEGISLVSPANTNETLTRGTDPADPLRPYATYFRITGRDDQQGPVAAEYLVEDRGARSFAVVDDGTAYGRGLTDGFVARATELGATIAVRSEVTEDQTDFGSVVGQIAPLAPDAVYYGGVYPAAGPLSAQLGAAGVTAPLVGGDGVVDGEFAGLGGRDGDLATVVGVRPDFLADAATFLADYAAAAYPTGAGSFGPYAFDAANIVIDAAAETTRNRPWSPSWRQSLRSDVARTDRAGATGPLRFDGYGDLEVARYCVYEVRQGEFVPVAVRSR